MNWEQRLKRAQDTGRFTDEDRELAKLWITCPISEVADRIELKKGELRYGPTDLYLLLDGLYFTKGVEIGDISLSVNCYWSIRKQVEALEDGTDKVSRMHQLL